MGRFAASRNADRACQWGVTANVVTPFAYG